MENNNVSNDKSSDTGSTGRPSASKAGTVALLAFAVFAILAAPTAINADSGVEFVAGEMDDRFEEMSERCPCCDPGASDEKSGLTKGQKLPANALNI